MRNNGLFDTDKIKETAATLANEWTPNSEDYDQTILRLKFKGVKNRTNITQTHDLIDFYDRLKNISSMARTTGYTCAAVANIILSGDFKENGVFTLENFGKEIKLVNNILHYLSERNIEIN